MVDILLATYNGKRFLAVQIDSILSQTYTDWKLLIRDDGSTDGTLHIITDFARRYPDKIIPILDTDNNLGVTRNFERLMEHATSPYLMFCDQDDIWLNEKIEKSLTKLQEMEKVHGTHTPLLVYTDLAVCNEEGEILSNSFWTYQGGDFTIPLDLAKALVQNNATGNTMIFNRALVNNALPFSSDAVMHDWWVSLTALYLGKIDYLSDQTIMYRQHNRNVSGSKGKNILPMLRKLPQYCHTLEKNIQQSNSFLENFRTQLDQQQINTLQTFTTLFYINKFKRLYKLLQSQFLTLDNFKDIGKICMFIICSKKEHP
ncbi:MAG: glycosyltransferase family 2 protein [Campylobacterales bacterium]|nr:glycosyltransferase family 2 protein [Campylobacterales bacterium]